MFEYIKKKYKEGDFVTLRCNEGTYSGQICFISDSALAVVDVYGRKHMFKGEIIEFFEDFKKEKYIESCGHYYVDLGLPSLTKWAVCNVGATKPTEYGDYFSWGEIGLKSEFEWRTYKWCKGSYDTTTKYCTSKMTKLEPKDDAATAIWGACRTPNCKELEELIRGCIWVWTDDFFGSGVAGRFGTSKTNGNTIFLPASGGCIGKCLKYKGSTGLYWSSELGLHSSIASALHFFEHDAFVDNTYQERYKGFCIRTVI